MWTTGRYAFEGASIQLARPTTMVEALETFAASGEDASYIAGGQSLGLRLRCGCKLRKLSSTLLILTNCVASNCKEIGCASAR